MNNISQVTCKEVMQHICESLGEELNSPKCVGLKAHLTDCPKCQNYFYSVEKTIECYRNYSIQFPQGAHQKLMKFLGLE